MNTSEKKVLWNSNISRRTFIKAGIAGAATVGVISAAGYQGYEFFKTVDVKGRILIIGGGAAGCSMAARLSRRIEHPDITIVDPSDRQFYQPGFTFIAAGIFKPDEVWRPQKDYIPQGVKWVKDVVVALDPVKQVARTSQGETLQ